MTTSQAMYTQADVEAVVEWIHEAVNHELAEAFRYKIAAIDFLRDEEVQADVWPIMARVIQDRLGAASPLLREACLDRDPQMRSIIDRVRG